MLSRFENLSAFAAKLVRTSRIYHREVSRRLANHGQSDARAGGELAAALESFMHPPREQLMGGVSDSDLASTPRVFAAFEAALETAESRGGGG
jgi:hypothetical protein